jgi:hypothetical protein
MPVIDSMHVHRASSQVWQSYVGRAQAAAAGVRVVALRCGLEVVGGRGVVQYLGPAEVLLKHGLPSEAEPL